MITGFTSHKLDLISTYDKIKPFKVGVKGVTNIEYSDPIQQTGYTKIYYTIDDINYITTYSPPLNQFDTNAHPTTFSTNISGNDFNVYSTPDGSTQYTFDIKEEAKMGLVFPPKVSNDLFIERMSVAVFERHSRLADIKSMDDLMEYRNGGYYNIVENN